jgi:hypothetical protein
MTGIAERPLGLWAALLALACVTGSCQGATPSASPVASAPLASAQASATPIDPNAGCDPPADPFADPPVPGREVPARGPARPGAERETEQFMQAIAEDGAFQRSVGFRLYTAGDRGERGVVHIEGAACHQDFSAAALQARYGPDRTSLTLYPLPGQEPVQSQSGKGWRLLAELPMVRANPTLQAAEDEDSYRALMARLGIAKPPKVDMSRAIVIAMMTSGGPHAGTPQADPCDWVHFEGISVDDVARTVVSKIRHPRPPGVGCDTLFVAFTYVVALDRAALPPPPFKLRMLDGGCEDCANEVVIRTR